MIFFAFPILEQTEKIGDIGEKIRKFKKVSGILSQKRRGICRMSHGKKRKIWIQMGPKKESDFCPESCLVSLGDMPVTDL